MANTNIVGVTTNPSIFRAALMDGAAYRKQIGELAARGTDVDDVDLTDVFEVLESAAVEKFEHAWNDLLESVNEELAITAESSK